jgi:hypothetical protein
MSDLPEIKSAWRIACDRGNYNEAARLICNPMSDLPERIWLARDTSMPSHRIFESYPDREPAREYLRADLAPAVGFSREQMMDAMKHADFEGFYTVEENAEYLASITPSMPFVPTEDELITVFSEEYTNRPVGNRVYHGIKAIHALLSSKATRTPAAQPRDPAVLVEALERIVSYETKLIGHLGARNAAVRIAREALAEWKGGLNE